MKDAIQKIIRRSSDPKLIEEAFKFAKEAYKEKKRISGENYIHHAVRVASALDEMGLDATTIAFGLLHDVADDIPSSAEKIELQDIEKKFGAEIERLVENISSLCKIRYSLTINIKNWNALTREKVEDLRRMFLAIAGDLRVVLVELVSRLDGLNFLNYLPEDQQKLYALETLRIFVPVANRLGLSEIRRNLEDLSFSYLYPKKFKWLKENVKEEYEEREKFLRHFTPRLKKIFKKEHLLIKDINYRAKSYWSTYKKLLTHDMNFNRIHDLIALRIIVKDIPDCYKTLGIIHKYCKPISEEINDYIAKPKSNGYRSLHTTVLCEDDRISEIQIRTEEMHKEAEFGICAHWSYKEKIDLKKEGGNFEWMKGASDFWKSFKIDFFKNQVFAFTPKGDVISLPKGSTAVDFAYAVHSEIGNRCETAKVGGKIVSLNHILKNGDVVEIIVNKNKSPSKDWLRFVKTSLAKSHIKKIVEENEAGFRIPFSGFIKRKISEISEVAKKFQGEKQKIKKENPRQIFVGGQKGMMVHIAKCCNPQPDDKVKAYLAKNRAAVLHRTSCGNFKKIAKKFPEKIVDASWE